MEKLEFQIIKQNNENLVSARELYDFLENTERFSSWFSRQLQYGFEEEIDYVGCKVFNTLANQELQDYLIKLDMAKEISMLAKNEKGRVARKYFIEIEKEFKNIVVKTEEEMILELFPNTDMALVTMTANTIRQNKVLAIELKEEKEYISHVVHNERYYITPTTMANKYGISAVKFNKILQDLNVQYKKGKKWCLKADYYGIGDYAYFEKPNGEWEKGSSLRYSNDGERVLYKILTANGHEPVRDIL